MRETLLMILPYALLIVFWMAMTRLVRGNRSRIESQRPVVQLPDGSALDHTADVSRKEELKQKIGDWGDG